MLSEYLSEKQKVAELNLENLDWYCLVNNYGFTFTINNIKFDIRHWLNSYGCEVNYWSITDNSKIGTKGCFKSFSTLNEILSYVKAELL